MRPWDSPTSLSALAFAGETGYPFNESGKTRPIALGGIESRPEGGPVKGKRAKAKSYTDKQARAGLKAPLPEIETWPNQYPDYEITITIPEYTSVILATFLRLRQTAIGGSYWEIGMARSLLRRRALPP